MRSNWPTRACCVNDAAVQPAAALQLDGVNLDAKQLQWP